MPNRVPFGGAARRQEAKSPVKVSKPDVDALRKQAVQNRTNLNRLYSQYWALIKVDDDQDRYKWSDFSYAVDKLNYLVLNESISRRDYHNVAHDIRSIFADMDKDTRDTARQLLLSAVEGLHGNKDFSQISTSKLVRIAALVGEAYALANLASPPGVEIGDNLDSDRSGLPPLFERRPTIAGKAPTAMQWFDEHWKARVEAGTSGDDIRRADIKFYNAFASALRREGKKLSDILPPSPTRGRKGADVPDRAERQRSLSRERVRRFRAAQKPR